MGFVPNILLRLTREPRAVLSCELFYYVVITMQGHPLFYQLCISTCFFCVLIDVNPQLFITAVPDSDLPIRLSTLSR